MTAFYNEIDPFAADWIRNLIDAGHIAPGDVDTRSITEVQPDDIKHYTQVHFFAGIGGWSLALRLAGWPDDRPVWTGSCPCQPFSTAGKRKGVGDERHLWPEMFRLVRECRPATVFGEQVASTAALSWFDGVCADVEALSYACTAVDLPAACVGAQGEESPLIRRLIALAERAALHLSGEQREYMLAVAEWLRGIVVGAPHLRQRLWWVAARAISDAENSEGRARVEEVERRAGGWRDRPAIDGVVDPVEHPAVDGRDARGAEPSGRCAARGCGDGSWSDFAIVHCLDGKARRIGSSIPALVDGLPRDMGRGQPELFRLARRARGNRTGRLRGYGNAIVPQVAAEFIRAVMERRP